MPHPLLSLAASLWLAAAPGDDPEIKRIAVAPAETLSVSITGEGPPVVVIPGLLGSAYGFRQVRRELAAMGYRVIIVELLGTGGSTRPERADYSLTAQSHRVEAVLDHLGIGDALLLCHTIGASVGYRMTVRRPDLVAGIVSVNGGPAESAGTDGLRFALKFAPLIKLFSAEGMVKDRIRDGLVESSYDGSWVTDAVVAGYTAPFDGDLGGALDALERMVSAREPDSIGPQLHRIDAPVHLLVGAGSTTGPIDPTEIDTLEDELPHFRLDSIPAVGQYIHEEMPLVVAAAVDEMMKCIVAGRVGGGEHDRVGVGAVGQRTSVDKAHGRSAKVRGRNDKFRGGFAIPAVSVAGRSGSSCRFR